MNRLANETSAYLRQHMRNPVDWYPWGAEALERAKAQDRPLLVSIGYSACHWCHVMERESFEDGETAELMNRLFVNVKVDREERPDVDRLYMDYLLRSAGHGGWPLTVFCTPAGLPFHAGTYFPPERRHGMPAFREVLQAVADAWTARRSELESAAAQAVAVLSRRPRGVATEPPGPATLAASAAGLLAGADREHGGFGGAPKFPTPTSLEALLAAVDVLPAETARDALAHVVLSCREMARRGLFDQLGGGFHRYCVDATWTIPHFEKMLYDQGLLLRVYAEAARRVAGAAGAPDPELAWPVRETVAWLRRDMAAPDGGFFASQDADSEGEEGRYYVWTPAQVCEVLGAERGGAFCAAYGVTPEGNFEQGASQLVDLARRPREVFAGERETLRTARSTRVPPGTDRKRVASWNAWLVSGLARAGSVLGDDTLLEDASATADFLLAHMRDERGRVLHVYDEGRGRVLGFLEDVGGMLDACLDLFRARSDGRGGHGSDGRGGHGSDGRGGGGGDRFLSIAAALAEDVVARFWDPAEDELFLTPADGEPLAHRPRAEPDGATPHAAGLAALGLVRAAALTGRREWAEVAERVLRGHAFVLERVPQAYPTLARTAAALARGISVAVIVGAPDDPATAALAARARRVLSPEDGVVVAAPGSPGPAGLDPAWLAGREAVGGRPTAYVCRGASCSLPVTAPEDLAPLAAQS